jgi:acyl carrier protein
MELDIFVVKFSEQFNETDSSLITADTAFRELEEWSSLISLSLIAMADEVYGVKLRGEDIKKSIYVKDLFEAVKNKRKL